MYVPVYELLKVLLYEKNLLKVLKKYEFSEFKVRNKQKLNIFKEIDDILVKFKIKY